MQEVSIMSGYLIYRERNTCARSKSEKVQRSNTNTHHHLNYDKAVVNHVFPILFTIDPFNSYTTL